MKTRHIAWSMFFMLVFVGVPVGVGAFWTRAYGVAVLTADTTRSSLFSSVATLAGVLLSVMLAVLAIITSMDERPLIKELKDREDGAYDRLIYALLSPVLFSILLTVLAVVAIAVPGPVEADTARKLAAVPLHPGPAVFFSITLGVCATVLGQACYLAVLIARMLVFKGRPTLLTPADAPPPGTRPRLGGRSGAGEARPSAMA